MARHKVFSNVEVFIVEGDNGAKVILDVGKLRIHSEEFSTTQDAMKAAAFLDTVIAPCIENGVFGDLRQGELF